MSPFVLRTVPLLLLLRAGVEGARALSDYTQRVNTDVTPCVPPCVRVGNCGDYPPSNGTCNVTWLAEQCSALFGCVAFNSNGWLKGCANSSCGAAFESVAGTDTFVNTSSGGNAVRTAPCTVQPIEDDYYPDEELAESAANPPPSVTAAWPGANGTGLATFVSAAGVVLNASVGALDVFGFEFVALLPTGPGTAVLERSFRRWGFLVYLSISGEVARLRKSVGRAGELTMPHYGYLADEPCGYYEAVYNNKTDLIGQRILAETDGEATFLAAAKYLPPQRDYASIGAIDPYHKFSVSPDGRIKIADSDIWTTSTIRNATGPGTLVFDPAPFVDASGSQWPETNWTFTKSGLVGRYLRVVATVGFSFETYFGFEQIAFAPASESSHSAFIRLRGVEDSLPTSAFAYFNASSFAPSAPLDPVAFYMALLEEQQLWNVTFAGATSFSLPGREGARQVDAAAGALVASLSLYVGLTPNYGDGADYWSPQCDRGGSLPFQEIAVVQNLLDTNLAAMAADRLGYWLDHYLLESGAISTCDWEDSCPGHFADGLADYGEMLDLFARVGRMELAANVVNGSAWLEAHMMQGFLLANYSVALRLAAVARGEAPGINASAGLIFGSPEHDLCHDPGFYYHNSAFLIRGLIEIGKFFRDLCATPTPAYCVPGGLAAFGVTLLAEAARFRADFEASLKMTVTYDEVSGLPLFVPPVAVVGIKPYASMIESTIAEYSNFRFYSELLGADVLSPAMSHALQDFRESTQGTVSGITRWSDHLDDMPSSYYLAASLRDDRIPRFLLLQYGHLANYMGRGTLTATEQLPIMADANGLSRDYLWSYLEGGIDMCVPSVMLPAIASRWQLVLERYDEDVLYLCRGAPRRWFAPSDGGFAIARSATRFGLVSLGVANSLAAGGGEDTLVSVSFARWAGPMPGVTTAPAFALRLRASSAALGLIPASVKVTGAATLVGVDVASSTVHLAVQGDAVFQVAASFR